MLQISQVKITGFGISDVCLNFNFDHNLDESKKILRLIDFFFEKNTKINVDVESEIDFIVKLKENDRIIFSKIDNELFSNYLLKIKNREEITISKNSDGIFYIKDYVEENNIKLLNASEYSAFVFDNIVSQIERIVVNDNFDLPFNSDKEKKMIYVVNSEVAESIHPNYYRMMINKLIMANSLIGVGTSLLLDKKIVSPLFGYFGFEQIVISDNVKFWNDKEKEKFLKKTSNKLIDLETIESNTIYFGDFDCSLSSDNLDKLKVHFINNKFEGEEEANEYLLNTLSFKKIKKWISEDKDKKEISFLKNMIIDKDKIIEEKNYEINELNKRMEIIIKNISKSSEILADDLSPEELDKIFEAIIDSGGEKKVNLKKIIKSIGKEISDFFTL